MSCRTRREWRARPPLSRGCRAYVGSGAVVPCGRRRTTTTKAAPTTRIPATRPAIHHGVEPPPPPLPGVAGRPALTSVLFRRESPTNQPPCVPPVTAKIFWPGFMYETEYGFAYG